METSSFSKQILEEQMVENENPKRLGLCCTKCLYSQLTYLH